MEVSVSRGDLGTFITDHARGFETSAALKGVGLHIENHFPGEYDFDADKWHKILLNLLSNAIKFTPQGGRVSLCLKAGHNSGRPVAELQVSDTGIGIPADKLPFIFNRFYQVDDSDGKSVVLGKRVIVFVDHGCRGL